MYADAVIDSKDGQEIKLSDYVRDILLDPQHKQQFKMHHRGDLVSTRKLKIIIFI